MFLKNLSNKNSLNSFNKYFKPSYAFSGLSSFKCKSSLFNKRDHEDMKSKNPDNHWLSETDKDFRVTTADTPLQFSKNPIADNFGELKEGEIPEPLKYVRPFQMTTLDNGVRVCTETWNTPTAAVGVFVDAGSRYETQDTSGTAHFLEHLLFKGTKNRTKSKFEQEIENNGATLDAYTSREHTLFHMTCFQKDVKNCVSILGDMLQNPLLNKNQVDEEKDTIKTELEESNKDTQETIMEGVHFNCFRDHMIGQPILGDIDNIYNVTQDMIREYHANNYVGKNLVVVGTGGVNHQEFVDMVANEFGQLK
jgi:predicted Zn-dependent peptidase